MNDHSKKKEFLENYQKTFGAQGQVCLALKIPTKTADSWYQQDPIFKADIDTLDRSFIDIIEKRVLQKINEGDDKWMWRWLTCRAPDRWRESNSMSLTAIAQGGLVATRFEIVDKIVDPKTLDETKPAIEVKKVENASN
jgi:hypothetical protein